MADDNFCIKLKFKLQGGSRDIYMIVNGDNEIGTVEKKKKEPADLVAIKTIEAHGILAVVDNMSSNAVIRFQGLQFPISGWLSRDQKDSSYDLNFPHPGLPHLTSDPQQIQVGNWQHTILGTT